MQATHSLKRRFAATAGGLTVLALAAGGVAYATTPSAVPAVAASTTAKAGTGAGLGSGTATLRRHPLLALLRHSVHAQFIVHRKSGFVTVDLDRGTISSVSAGSISVLRRDGVTVTEAITSKTRFRGLAESSLVKGDHELVVSSGGNAVVIFSRVPKATTAPSSSSSASTASATLSAAA